MIVVDVGLEGFTVHGSTTLRFPRKGVVLVTGPNGSGKSSIIEGVSFAGFGETLRGTVPGGREANACMAHLCALAGERNVIVERTRRKDKTVLEWDFTNDESGRVPAGWPTKSWPTTSKAQAELEAVIGTFPVWQRTHVFSSEDVARFTKATDKERKLFLEGWAGLERFDRALKDCREDLTKREHEYEVLQGRAQMLKNELDAIVKRKDDAERTLSGLPPPAPAGGYATTLAMLRQSIKSTEAGLKELRDEMQKLDRATGTHDADMWALDSRRKRLAKPGQNCGECGRPLPDQSAEREKLTQEIEALKTTAEKAKAAVQSEIGGLKEQISDDERTLQRLREKESAAAREAGAIEATERTRKLATEALKSAQADVEAVRAKVEQAIEELPKLKREVAVLRAAEFALGLRGVRAGLLGRLLSGLEAAANAWLPKVAGQKARLELKSYSEKKSGGISDSISLQVTGVGGGEGYRGCSQGERRRIDVALMLAFAGRGTLFFDEVFDTLDTEGLEALVQVLGELAADRCVVVITHSDELAERIPHVQHWQVEGGAVRGTV